MEIIKRLIEALFGKPRRGGYDRSRRDFALPSNYRPYDGRSIFDQSEMTQNREGQWGKKFPDEKRRRGPDSYKPDTHGRD